MKNKKEETVTAEGTDTVLVGNCSKCNGPVMSKWYVGGVKVGEYQECLNCGAKHFPSFGKIVKMDNDKKDNDIIWEKNAEKLKDDLIKGDDYWRSGTYQPYPYHDPIMPPYNTPQYPGHPWTIPYTYPIITCGGGSYTVNTSTGRYNVYYTNY